MSRTAYLIAQANFNELGTGSGGSPGEQLGLELNARQWYSYPWAAVYRPVNAEYAEYIADFMERAVSNGYLGYDLLAANRRTLFDALQANGYWIDEVDKPCTCDCSSLVYCAVYGATGVAYVPAGMGRETAGTAYCPVVADYDGYLMEQCAGQFEKLTDSAYTQSPNKLLRGDILVGYGSSNHVAVWV